MKIFRIFILVLICVMIWMPSEVNADSCPYCGQSYGAPAPGDEARVNALRRAHEASCPSRPRASTPTYQQQQPRIDQWELRRNQQEEQRRREADEERRRKLKEAEEEAKRREEARRKQFEHDKQEALKMLKSGAGQLGLKSGADGDLGLKSVSGSDLKLKGIAPAKPALKEPLFSKGTKSSAPVDLKSIDPSRPPTVSPKKVKGEVDSQKGLRTNYVPKPALASLEDYPYDKKERTDIILDALEVGRGSYTESVRHLENYLKSVEPNNVKVQEALSFIQGMAEGDFLRRKMGEKTGLFDPSPDDSSALPEGIAGTSRRQWPGPTVNPELDQPLSNPLDWESVRGSFIAETVKLLPSDTEKATRKDFQKCIDALSKRSQEDPENDGVRQALLFFEGVISNY